MIRTIEAIVDAQGRVDLSEPYISPRRVERSLRFSKMRPRFR